jgi:putative redox protein
MDDWVTVDDLRLSVHVARPSTTGPVPAVALCHGFPAGPRGASSSASTFPELAARIAREIGWLALTFNFRGTGSSEGDFSPLGWLADLRAVVDVLDARDDVRDVWLVGVAEGGTLALCTAAVDERVRGLAALAAPSSLRDWGRDPTRLVEYARRVGMIHTSGFPSSPGAWGRESAAVDATAVARKLSDRPVLLLHGSDDVVVDVEEARALQAELGATAELHVVRGAGHELRHDPRAIAALLGWLDRRY